MIETKTTEDQTLTLPAGAFVCGADFDCKEPYIEYATNDENICNRNKVAVPQALAYYLHTHWCGSKAMHKGIEEDTRRSIRNDILEVLGIEI
jgi:hypothetical protein